MPLASAGQVNRDSILQKARAKGNGPAVPLAIGGRNLGRACATAGKKAAVPQGEQPSLGKKRPASKTRGHAVDRPYRAQAGWQVKFCAAQHCPGSVELASPAPIRPTTENDKPMPDINAPLRRDDDEPDDISVEERMRLALGRLGTKAAVGQGGPAGAAMSAQTGSQRRARFARNGEVPVERVPASRVAGDGQRELAGEREARQRSEQALADAQAAIASLQAALVRSEQATRAARDTVEEREAAMSGLRAELQRIAAERDALQAAQVAMPMLAKPRRVPAAPKADAPAPEPARWWLEYLKAPRP